MYHLLLASPSHRLPVFASFALDGGAATAAVAGGGVHVDHVVLREERGGGHPPCVRGVGGQVQQDLQLHRRGGARVSGVQGKLPPLRPRPQHFRRLGTDEELNAWQSGEVPSENDRLAEQRRIFFLFLAHF